MCGTLMLFWYPPFPNSSSGQCGSWFSITSHNARGRPHCCWQQGWLPVPISAPWGQHTAAARASTEEALPPATTPCAHTHAALPLGPAPSRNTCSFPASAAHVLAVPGPPGTGLASGWGQLFPSCVCEATRWTRSSAGGVAALPSHPLLPSCFRRQVPKGHFRARAQGPRLFLQEEPEAEYRTWPDFAVCSALCKQLTCPLLWRRAFNLARLELELGTLCWGKKPGLAKTPVLGDPCAGGTGWQPAPRPLPIPCRGRRDIFRFSGNNVRS